MSSDPGTRLGPYQITGQIGAGGMGDVYRATDTNLKRAVAVKVLPDALTARSSFWARGPDLRDRRQQPARCSRLAFERCWSRGSRWGLAVTTWSPMENDLLGLRLPPARPPASSSEPFARLMLFCTGMKDSEDVNENCEMTSSAPPIQTLRGTEAVRAERNAATPTRYGTGPSEWTCFMPRPGSFSTARLHHHQLF